MKDQPELEPNPEPPIPDEEPELPRIGLDPRLRDPAALYDALGRKQFTKMTPLIFVRAMPWTAKMWKSVPQAYVTIDDDEHGLFAVVACPCGSRQQLRIDSITSCAAEGCTRAYAFGGAHVWVAHSE